MYVCMYVCMYVKILYFIFQSDCVHDVHAINSQHCCHTFKGDRSVEMVLLPSEKG